MKRSIKITSALLVLVLLLAQVVCVSAATNYNPSISISMKQTDHYIKTVTAKVTGDTVSYIWMRSYNTAGQMAMKSPWRFRMARRFPFLWRCAPPKSIVWR